MLKIGLLVVHPRYGPAVVDEMKTMTYKEETKQYFCLRLMKNDDTVMIPEDAAEKIGLRMDLMTIDAIRDVFTQAPVVMDDDFRVRRPRIDENLKSTDPYDGVRLLRDLCWHEDQKQLTRAEQQIRDDLMEAVSTELAMVQQVDRASVQTRLEGLISRAMAEYQHSAAV